MNGAFSPTGETHPGEIEYADKIEGRTWNRRAEEVPPSIAWVKVAGVYEPVVRIDMTGNQERRCITKFGARGQMLETTVMTSSPHQ